MIHLTKLCVLVSLLFGVAAFAQTPKPPSSFSIGVPAVEQPYFEFVWDEADGTVPVPDELVKHFAGISGRVEVDWIPRVLYSSAVPNPDTTLNKYSQHIFSIPNHLNVWIWKDGIHGNWYNDAGEERLYRARWGLPSPGVEVKIVLTWNSDGYAVVIDDILRIHDWQTQATTVYPDPDAVSGIYGNRVDGSAPATGSFKLRTYDGSVTYNPCIVDVVGTINADVPSDNSGAWDQGIDPQCFIGAATLNWENTTERMDDTPMPIEEIAAVGIYNSITHEQITTVSPQPPTHIIDMLPPGEHCFYGTTIDTDGLESDASNTVCKTVE